MATYNARGVCFLLGFSIHLCLARMEQAYEYLFSAFTLTWYQVYIS